MEQIIITKRDGSRVPILSRHTATNITSAKQNWTLNGDDTVDITVKSPYPQKYDIGDKITIFGRDYTLNRLPRPKKTGAFAFEYTLQFEGVQYDLLRASYDVTIDTTNNQLQDVQGDSLTGDLRRFLTVLVANANRVFPGKWSLGECPDTASDVTLTFGESDNCLSVLQSILGKFDESYFFDIEISGGRYIINIKTKSNILPFTLEFGKGNGLYMLSRDNVSSANIITRLKVYGSTSNITNKYRADRLCLPGKSKGQSYIEKPEAVAKYGIFEGRKHFENIKPTFTGHVQSVGESGVEFIDTSISFDLNAKEADGVTTRYLIDGVNAKIHFNSGNLAGYEFDIVKYDHATHKVTLRRFTDDRGDVFPSETSLAFKIGVGNEYKILNIALPPELEAKAEAELEEAGNKYYDQNSQPKVQYSLSVTRAFIEKHFATDAGIVNVFIPGNYVPIKDPDIGVDKSVRIKSITRNILNPYEYSLTISDTVTTSVTNRVISDIIDIDKIIEINNLNDHARARANWRSSREVLDMVFDPEGDYYTDKIKPNSIDTLALSVGAKSMQFALSNTIFKPNYGGDVNVMKWQGGVLTHYTISEESARSWNIQDGEITFNESSRPYYIYAKCSKSSEQGQFVITEKQYKVEQEPDCYYFWVGVVNSVDADIKARTLSLLYGFTTINGRYIKTGRIESSGNGQSFFDLDSNQFVLGDCLSFNKDNDKRLLLKGTFVQSTSGDESPLPCYRGVWNASIVYFTGDSVIYAIDGKYSLYQCVKQCKNITPNNHADYWVCLASAGSDGKDGNNGTDGQKGDPGKSPAMVFRGDYNSNKIYYGNEHRLDCVKYNGAYYIARIDAGTFTNVAPTNTSKWNPFGASFESVATELLLAENANIANLIFRNQRLESSATSNGVPNFFIDGFNNIASFAAGNVAFDKTGAKIGWLRVVGKDLIGYDDNGITRLRLTPDALPPVTSMSTKLANVSGSGGNSDVTTEVDQNESFYAEKFVHQYTNSDDGNFDDDGSMSCWVDIDIPAASTTLYLSDMQFGVMDAKSLSGQHVSPNVQIYASVKYKNGNTIGSVDLSNGNAQITIPTAGTVRLSITVSCNYGVTDWNGRAYVSFPGFPISETANNTVIAKDGIMATFNGNYMRMHSSEGFSVKVGNNYFRITSSGIQKSTNGSTWTNL